MTTALVLGSADTLWRDIVEYMKIGGTYDFVVACNEAIVEWPHHLKAAVSIHGRFFEVGARIPGKQAWRKRREERGFPPPERWYGHNACVHAPEYMIKTSEMFPEQSAFGSSGCFAAKVALIDLAADNAVLCGIPMLEVPHVGDDKNWGSAGGFFRHWPSIPEHYRSRMRSMSGRTRDLLGSPEV